MTYADSMEIINLRRENRLLKEQLEEARIWEHTARANGEDYQRLKDELERLRSEPAVVQTKARQ